MLRGSSKYQDRVLTIIGLTVLLCVALVAFFGMANPLAARPDDKFSLVINTPYVGQGVEAGTPVVLRGVEVGQVSTVANTAGGGVRLVTDLQKQPVEGLTDALAFDFRTINYFGVPGVNLDPKPGGRLLRDGSEISLVPTGNFTLSELLSQLGDVSAASLTPQLIGVMDRVTRYTDGLNPLFETAVAVTQAVADVQTVPTEQLLANTASIAAAFPGFNDSAIEATRRITDYNYYPGQTFPPAATIPQRLTPPFLEGVAIPNLADVSEEYFQGTSIAFAEMASEGLFAAVGKLLSSHVDDLFPLISGIKALTDVTPPLLRPADIAQKTAELRSRFERLYAGNGEQSAISVRVVLDSLPGVAAPLGIVTGAAE
jgi:phospholipid/cholesterol/gamma-HCH transport system substrate-binding protein